jgi:hypothetical protein
MKSSRVGLGVKVDDLDFMHMGDTQKDDLGK